MRFPLVFVLLACFRLCAAASLEQIMSAPFPSGLMASPNGDKVAWTLNERGARNIWVAEAPDYRGRRLTAFRDDDGQEIEQMQWLRDGSAIVYVRGGDFEMGRENPNPRSSPALIAQSIFIVPLAGGGSKKLADGNSPAVSPSGDRLAFVKDAQVWVAATGADPKPLQLIRGRGRFSTLSWSPDGQTLAFVSNRGGHSFVGVYRFLTSVVQYLDPSVDVDSAPAWSADGKNIAFIRVPTSTRGFRFGPDREAEPWSIRIANVETGTGHEIWHARRGPGSVPHEVVGEHQIVWAGNRLVFPWEADGWLHLYSIAADGGEAVLLTPGDFEVEHVSAGAGQQGAVFSSNQDDADRRHIWRVRADPGAKPVAITSGDGIEWNPVALTGGFAFLRSGSRQPARAAIQLADGKIRDLALDAIPSEFPASELVEPQPVLLSASDGMKIHAQLFMPRNAATGKHPALIFFHGGSRRQMLLGWHYMYYYNNAYAMNQYLASLGYIVLSVNYRSGIGYGLNFREALNYGAAGASEYNDVMGAGLYMRNRPDVDPARIGLWGGSYGGYLTAMGLSRASDLFAAGVDFHGVHDWNVVTRNFSPSYDPKANPDIARIAYESSPMSSVSTWKSPVLLIHGDDDRNVPFSETVQLVEALRKQGVAFEQLIFPDEVHDFLTFDHWISAYKATADFFARKMK